MSYNIDLELPIEISKPQTLKELACEHLKCMYFSERAKKLTNRQVGNMILKHITYHLKHCNFALNIKYLFTKEELRNYIDSNKIEYYQLNTSLLDVEFIILYGKCYKYMCNENVMNVPEDAELARKAKEAIKKKLTNLPENTEIARKVKDVIKKNFTNNKKSL